MIEVKCPSCQTRYHIDEGVLPQDSPTFKCSRCGHVFSGDPRLAKRPAAPKPRGTQAPQQDSAAPPSAPPPPPRPAPLSAAAQMPAAAAEARAANDTAENQQRQSKPTGPATSSNTTYTPPPAAPRNRAERTTGNDADNPLARSFDDEGRSGENLSFDFGEEAGEQHQLGDTDSAAPDDRYDRWRVGDPDAEREAPAITPELRRYQARRAALAQAGRRSDRAPEAEAASSERVRSAGFFLGLFALIVVGFAVLTFLLGLSPWVSRELLAQVPVIGGEFIPAAPRPSVVALNDVHAEYRMLDSKRRALIVSGRAENRGAQALHTIQVGVSLVDSQQHPILSQSVYCGDLVSPKIVSQMTPHELQFFQKLAPPRNFALRSGDSSPFFVMFIDPPPAVANFQVSVLKAEAAGGEDQSRTGV